MESKGLVFESIHKFMEKISRVDESELRLKQLGLPFDREIGVRKLEDIYL